jgi:hypothetical protein
MTSPIATNDTRAEGRDAHQALQFMAGGGKAGALMRAQDWSA